MAAVVADDALRAPCRAARVEAVEGIGRGNRDAGHGLRVFERLVPVRVPARGERGVLLRALEDDAAGLRAVLRDLERPIDERLVGDDPVARFEAARGGNDQLRLGVIDARRQLMRGEASEDHRVHGAEAGAGEHRHHRLGDHRHVDDDPVAATDALVGEGAGEPRHLVPHAAIGDRPPIASERAVPHEGELIAPAFVDMAVERVVAGVQLAAHEPAVEWRSRIIEDPIPLLAPADAFRDPGPERLRIGDRPPVDLVVIAHRASGKRDPSIVWRWIATERRSQATLTFAPGLRTVAAHPLGGTVSKRLVSLLALIAACSSNKDTNDLPSFVKGDIVKATYDGSANDLLTGGLGKTGLASAVPPTFANPASPTVAELRTRAIHANYRALIDPTPQGGYGVLYGPNIDINGGNTLGEGKIAGDEWLAFDDDGTGRVNVTMMVQVPATFDKNSPCIVSATSSGSRGVYGAIATAGEWGLKHGCAVAYTDQGSGMGVHDLQANTVNLIDGTRTDAATAGTKSSFTANLSDADRTSFNATTPNRFAVKHAHSQQNPEKDWGLYTLHAVEFAFYMLNE